MVYGLGTMGEAGVSKALEIMHEELDMTMAFCGHTKIGTVDRSILLPGSFQPPEVRRRGMAPAFAGACRRCKAARLAAESF